MKVVEHDANLVDLHPGFGKHYQDHELFRHVNEASPLQLDALDQSGHSNNVHAFEHGHFASFRWNYFQEVGPFWFINNFECLTYGSYNIFSIVSSMNNTKTPYIIDFITCVLNQTII
jgi:hypothetical protein